MKSRMPPPEGTVFLVPLRDDGFSIGVLARADNAGRAFGYFFGPRVGRESRVHLPSLRPDQALLVGMFGDLELLRGNWPLIGSISPWSRSAWPIPPLARVDEVAGKAWLSTYGDDLRCTSENPISVAEAARHPYDRLMGAGAVEIRLTKLIRELERQPG